LLSPTEEPHRQIDQAADQRDLRQEAEDRGQGSKPTEQTSAE
jgi:hypothetical protein